LLALANDFLGEKLKTKKFLPNQTTTSSFQCRTLEGLVAKGVKVDLGMPKELWHKPSAEITHLKTQCESLIESHEEDIEDWYFSHQSKQSLEDYLCRQRALKGAKDQECLEDENRVSKKKKKSSNKKDKKQKGDSGSKSADRDNSEL
jgi:hypothetical protein